MLFDTLFWWSIAIGLVQLENESQGVIEIIGNEDLRLKVNDSLLSDRVDVDNDIDKLVPLIILLLILQLCNIRIHSNVFNWNVA